jgi:hypothetical protein
MDLLFTFKTCGFNVASRLCYVCLVFSPVLMPSASEPSRRSAFRSVLSSWPHPPDNGDMLETSATFREGYLAFRAPPCAHVAYPTKKKTHLLRGKAIILHLCGI